MTAIAWQSPLAFLVRLLRDPASWMTAVDVFAILTAASLPFSTSLPAIFIAAMLVASVPLLDLRSFVHSLRRPIAAVPIAFFALVLIGTLWSGAAWGVRFYAVLPAAKLLMLPVLFYHFERSERGAWVLIAFLVSCTLLMTMSWIVAFVPALSLKPADDAWCGIFVKNYIDQSQEFALCAVALAYPVIQLLRARKIWPALALCAIALSLILNMVLVIVSRTALVTLPIMLALFALLHLRLRTNLLILGAAIVVALAVWITPFGTVWSSISSATCQTSGFPQLEWTFQSFSREYLLYRDQHRPTSIGERLTYWKHSLRFLAEAPLVGHGTGSSKSLFEQAARGPDWSPGVRVYANPHNQTLNVAIQWGGLGIAVLYAMWLVHLLLFRGDGLANWIGLLVVVQNIFTSLFNSHLFDFHEGWMYVLGVGIAGGMVLRAKAAAAAATDS